MTITRFFEPDDSLALTHCYVVIRANVHLCLFIICIVLFFIIFLSFFFRLCGCGDYFSSKAQISIVSLYSSVCHTSPDSCSLLTFCLLSSFPLLFFLFPLVSCCPISPLCLSLPISTRLSPCLPPARRSGSPSFLDSALLSASLLLPQEPFYRLPVLLSSRYSWSVFCPGPFSALLSSCSLPSSPICVTCSPSTSWCSFSDSSSHLTFFYMHLCYFTLSSSCISSPPPSSSLPTCASLLPPTLPPPSWRPTLLQAGSLGS